MDQGENIYRVAQDVIASRGGGAYAYLCEQAEVAKLTGDRDSAITWWDIALAVVDITGPRGAALPTAAPSGREEDFWTPSPSP